MDLPASSTPHAVVFPFPHQGHVIPALHLAVQLASSGAIVTFVNTERNHEKFVLSHAADFAHQKNAPIDLRFVTISDGLPPELADGPPPFGHAHSGPPPFGHERSGHPPPPWDAQHPEPSDASDATPTGHRSPGGPPPPDPFVESLAKQGPALEKLIEGLQTEGSRVCCLIVDEFMPWAGEVAQKLKIPWVVFWTSSAAWLCGTYASMKEEDSKSASEDGAIDPGLPSIGTHQGLRPPPPEGFRHDMRAKKKAMENADCMLVNACDELEREAFAAIPLNFPIWSVGPLILGAASRFDQLHGGFSKPDEECIPWLDTQQADSVLYISFGSRSHLPAAQLTEIARGIEASGKPFLWVERGVEQLPEGFRERTKGLGRVVKWAPQREVLAHKSVGAFVTHCGWNSILETMDRGVPMVCWPQFADQGTNREIVEEKWKIGRGLVARGRQDEGRHGEAKEVVQSSHLSRVVKEVMEDEEMRQRARLLSHSSKLAMAPGGSSYLHLQAFLHHINPSSSL